MEGHLGDLNLVLIFPNSITSSGKKTLARMDSRGRGNTLAPLEATVAEAVSVEMEEEGLEGEEEAAAIVFFS